MDEVFGSWKLILTNEILIQYPPLIVWLLKYISQIESSLVRCPWNCISIKNSMYSTEKYQMKFKLHWILLYRSKIDKRQCADQCQVYIVGIWRAINKTTAIQCTTFRVFHTFRISNGQQSHNKSIDEMQSRIIYQFICLQVKSIFNGFDSFNWFFLCFFQLENSP